MRLGLHTAPFRDVAKAIDHSLLRAELDDASDTRNTEDT
jgi:hypothetical protein